MDFLLLLDGDVRLGPPSTRFSRAAYRDALALFVWVLKQRYYNY
jgi:hypothetical protein